jgi:hypothetical protein
MGDPAIPPYHNDVGRFPRSRRQDESQDEEKAPPGGLESRGNSGLIGL